MHYLMAYCRNNYNTIANKTQLYVSVRLFDDTNTKPILNEDINFTINGFFEPKLGVCDIDEDGLNEIIIYDSDFAVIKIK